MTYQWPPEIIEQLLKEADIMTFSSTIEELLEKFNVDQILFTKAKSNDGKLQPAIKANQVIPDGGLTPRLVTHQIIRNDYAECLNSLYADAKLLFNADWSKCKMAEGDNVVPLNK